MGTSSHLARGGSVGRRVHWTISLKKTNLIMLSGSEKMFVLFVMACSRHLKQIQVVSWIKRWLRRRADQKNNLLEGAGGCLGCV